MTAFYWFKAAPGSYYLYDLPRSADARVSRPHIGKVANLDHGKYLLRVEDNRHVALAGGLLINGRYTPKTAIADVERWLRAQVPDATFSRENF